METEAQKRRASLRAVERAWQAKMTAAIDAGLLASLLMLWRGVMQVCMRV